MIVASSGKKKIRNSFSNEVHANKSVEYQDLLHKVTTDLFTSEQSESEC